LAYTKSSFKNTPGKPGKGDHKMSMTQEERSESLVKWNYVTHIMDLKKKVEEDLGLKIQITNENDEELIAKDLFNYEYQELIDLENVIFNAECPNCN
jgi:hypothetical protein